MPDKTLQQRLTSNTPSELGTKLAVKLIAVASLLLLPLCTVLYLYVHEQRSALTQLRFQEKAIFGVAAAAEFLQVATNYSWYQPNQFERLQLAAPLTRIESALAFDHHLMKRTHPLWAELTSSFKDITQVTQLQRELPALATLLQQINLHIGSEANVAAWSIEQEPVRGVNSAVIIQYLANNIVLANELTKLGETEALAHFDLAPLQAAVRLAPSFAGVLAADAQAFSSDETAEFIRRFALSEQAFDKLLTSIKQFRLQPSSANLTKVEALRQEAANTLAATQVRAANLSELLLNVIKGDIAFKLKVREKRTFVQLAASLLFSALALVLGGFLYHSIRARYRLLSSHAQELEHSITSYGAELNLARNKVSELGNELKHQSQKAGAAKRAKSRFLASMSHEIRTPLNAMLGGVNLLGQAALTPEQRTTLQMVQSSGGALLNLVNDILDFSKIEAGEITIEQQAFDLEEIVLGVTNNALATARDKGIAVLLDFPYPCEGEWLGDPGRIRQILLNLVGNALKFTEHGCITLTVRQQVDTLELTVSDTGIGMTVQEQEQLFYSFSQADSSITRKFGGIGLGLTLCRSLVELMYGTIAVKSEPNVGSRFVVNLPLKRPKGVEPPSISALAKCQLLVINGHPIVLERLRDWHCHFTAITLQELESTGTKGLKANVILLHGRFNQEQLAAIREAFAEQAIILYGPKESHSSRYVDYYVTQHPRAAEARQLLVTAADQQAAMAHHGDPSMTELKYSGDVLLVEDVILNRVIAMEFLESLGLEVDCAEDGLQALHRFKRKRYNLVLMDLHMPNMNGIEATRAIRQYETEHQRSATPIVALSADVMRDTLDAAYRAGINDCISKPFDETKLHQAFSKYLPSYCQLRHPPENAQATAANTSAEPLFDAAGLLKRVRHKPERARLLLNAYRSEQDSLLHKLAAAASAGDSHSLAQQAHALKGVSANLGLMQISHIAADIESSARQSQNNVWPEHLEHLSDIMAQTNNTVDSELASWA